MFGASLLQGKLGRDVPSREFDNYPTCIRTDFRRLDESSLRKYCSRYSIPIPSVISDAELARLVALHFESQLVLLTASDEEVIIRHFAEYLMSSSTSKPIDEGRGTRNGGRRRKKTKRGLNSESSDEEGVTEHDENDQTTYCICNRKSYGEMVECESGNCQYGSWFHYACVGLTDGLKSDSQWYCPGCIEDRLEEEGNSQH
jgi:hypothetical protein